MDSRRGQAATTLSSLVSHHDQHQQFFTERIVCLADDPLLAVRVCAARAVSTLIDHARDTALDAADRLLNGRCAS
jgi:hypothetical protein